MALGIFEELRFMLQLLGGELLFALTCCKRRDRFWLRFSIGTAVMIGCSFLYFGMTEILEKISLPSKGILLPLIFISYYTFLTLLSTYYLLFLFDFKIDQAIFHTCGGYCLQHISYVVFTELIARTWWTSIADNLWAYVLLSMIGFVLMCLLLKVTFVKNFKEISEVHFLGRKKSFIYFLIMLIIIIFLTFAGQSIYQNNSTIRIVENPNYLGAAVSLLSSLLILIIINMLYIDNQKTREKEIISQMLYEQGKQYEYKKETTEAFRKLAHDMKHKILAVKNSYDNQNNEVLNQMEKEVNEYDSLINTGNEAINVIIADKIMSTKSDNIRIEFDGDASLISFIAPVDLYVLLGNALDNAIEAIKRGESINRSISLSIKKNKGLTSVHVTNYFNGEINEENNVLKTSKKDNYFHGIGMKSMKQIVEKYNGSLVFEINENMFTLKAIFVENQ